LSTIFRGTRLPQPQSEEFDFDPTRGFLHRLHFRGASWNNMTALQQDFVRAGISCRLVANQGDTATLEVFDSTQQYTIDSWEIVVNEEGRDGLSHPGLINALTTASLDADKIIASARQHLQDNDDPKALFEPGGDFDGAPAILKRFYSLQVRGSTEYRRAQYCLRHRTNAPNRWAANIADYGIDDIYTYAQLLAEVQNSGLWVFPLPSRLAYKIGRIPVPTFQPNYLWGWLKSASTETAAPNNRIEITTEYVLEQWSTDYYPVLPSGN
jgi:hypothetical protein